MVLVCLPINNKQTEERWRLKDIAYRNDHRRPAVQKQRNDADDDDYGDDERAKGDS